MLQRWYFTAAGLLVTLLLCFLAASAVPVKYQATAQILVLPPKTSVGNGGNPYLALGGLQAAADVLARAMSDADTYAKVRAAGVSGTYTVARDLTTSGPVLLVNADDSTPDGALKTLHGILSQAAPRLAQLQDSLNVPDSTRLTSNVFTKDPGAAAQRKSQIRALLVAFAAGVFATIMLVSAGDSLLMRRARRRSAKTGALADNDAGSATSRPSRVAKRASARPSRGAKRGGPRPPQNQDSRGDRARELPSDEPDTSAEEPSDWSAVTTEQAGRRGNG